MHSSTKRTIQGIVGVLASLLLTIVVIACSGPTIQLIVTPTPTVQITLPPPIPHKTIIFCDDETGSYSPVYFHSAANQVAAWVTSIPQSNESGATVYIQWIEENSYSDAATYGRYDILAVPYDPPPPGAVATVPAMQAEQQQTAIASATTLSEAYQQQHAAYLSQLSAAQTGAASVARQIQRIQHNTAGSSDIWGCLQRATERFAEAPNDLKYLVIASDMEPVGPQEHAQVDLHGVQVTIINFETDAVGSYDSRVNYWTTQITKSGAAKPKFYRPDDQLPQSLF